MKKLILITGGAGFIGSHVADELLDYGYRVRALDSLSPEIHGDNGARPDYLNSEVDLIIGDVRNQDVLRRALKGVDAVFHFAAKMEKGYTLSEISDCTSSNILGTAVLLDVLSKNPVERLIISSSMRVYGEGLYQMPDGSLHHGTERSAEQLRRKEWELQTKNGEKLSPVPTLENKTLSLSSLYGLSKFNQERMCHMTGRAYHIPTVALRFFNVYGIRQRASNPYSGMLNHYASRLLNNQSPLILEDGLQQRDFVSVYDVARACRQALRIPAAIGQTFNIGSGKSSTMREIASQLSKALQKTDIRPQITERHGVGEIRHCFADIHQAGEVLQYEPIVNLSHGLEELAMWFEQERSMENISVPCAEMAEEILVA